MPRFAGALVALVLTPRAGWALVVRGASGRLQAFHTSDALVLELLRGRLREGFMSGRRIASAGSSRVGAL